MKRGFGAGAVVGAVLLAFASAASADEGMWTFEKFPAAKVKAEYGVDIDAAWLSRLRAASVRIPGCSGSIVSGEGLVLTNNHCVTGCLVALSTPTADHRRDGVLTASRDEERRCPGLYADVLIEAVDVSGKVLAAAAGKTGADYATARDEAMTAATRAACRFHSRDRCQTVSLYRGGRFVVSRYRRYNDVRMVFAPEFAAAFSGDAANFNFPRHDLDAAFLRLYVKDKPAVTPDFLVWNPTPPRDGELVFASGNPGSTERSLTVAQLETYRDLALPVNLRELAELRGRLIEYGRGSPQAGRLVAEPLFLLENTYKSTFGEQVALTDKAFMDAKRADEAALRARVAADPALAARTGDPWDEIARLQQAYADNDLRYRQLEAEAGGESQLFAWARTLVRSARADPSSARRAGIERRLLAPTGVEAALEQVHLEQWLLKSQEYLASDPQALAVVLGGETPAGLSSRLISGTRLWDPGVRQALWRGGLKAIEASDDPLIRYVLQMDDAAVEAGEAWQAEVSAPTAAATARIARARLAVEGDSGYPDANFTLRLSYGAVAGWTWRGVTTGPFTTLGEGLDRATGAEPYALPASWLAARETIDRGVIYNFTTTNDIVGGNSGSPLVNARGEVIGVLFDGNIHSLGGAFGYDPAANRAIAVSAAAITEVLDKVYGRDALLAELRGK